jgi:hypothetical protein
MNPIIMLVVAILLLIGAVLRSIEWRKLAANWVASDPKHATVFVKTGSIIKPCIGERDRDNDLMYNYKDGKEKKTITLPVNYPEEFLRSNGRRIIGVEDGKSIASPLGFMSEGDLKKYRESSVEISVLAQSQAIVKALRSISDTKPFNWGIVIIIGIVAIAGLYWYSNKNKPAEVVNTNNQTALNQPVTNPPNQIIINPPVKVTP